MSLRQNGFRKSLAFICALLLACVVALAQTAPQTPQSGEQQRVAVEHSFLVTDEAQRFVGDVRREEVRVTEDGTAQVITHFALEERPVSYGLIIDTTGSMRSLLDQVLETGRAIVKANRTHDETFVMHYVDADTIEFDTGWTSDEGALEAAFDEMFIQGGLTATLDALHQALTFATRPRPSDNTAPARRRALVIITDGEDRGSRQSNPELLLSRLRETDVQVFAIGLTKLVGEMRNRDKAMSFLTRLAQESGGRAFFPKSFAEMPDVLKELTLNLRSQYVLSYTPTNAKRDGSFRKVQITLAPAKAKRNVITRAGYTAPR